MSHHHNPTESIICPNCSSNATGNYCSQCGQETHLHKDTLWGLTMHFVGHYFHYDSKFWQTIKTLITSPGKLTLAYWEKQRSRYLSPISLYLFVSFIFFFFFFSITNSKTEHKKTKHTETEQVSTSDSIANAAIEKYTGEKKETIQAEAAQHNYFANQEAREQFGHDLLHNIPKLLFFMIPIMAIILKMLFFRRRDLTIVHHTIFSLHIQSFYFLCLTPTLNSFDNVVLSIITYILLACPVVYTTLAMRKVYQAGWVKAIVYNVVIIITYGILMLVVMGIYFAVVLAKSHYFPGNH